MRFRFLLPDSELWMEGSAQVASVDEGRIGLQFTLMRKELRLELANWLAARLEQEPLTLPAAPVGADMPPRYRPAPSFSLRDS